MTKHLIIVFGTALLIAGSLARVHADDSQKTLLVTMTNDPVAAQPRSERRTHGLCS